METLALDAEIVESIDRDAVTVRASDGRRIVARAALIAIGPNCHPPLAPEGPRWIGAPWPSGWARLRDANGRLLIVGTGLSAVDLALTALTSPGIGSVTMASLDGRTPLPHGDPSPAASRAYENLSPRALVREVRARAKTNGWRPEVDRLRCDIDALWAGWSDVEKRQALRVAPRVWTPSRHRCPVASLDALAHASASGRLRIRKGRIAEVRNGASGLVARIDDVDHAFDFGADARGFARLTSQGACLNARALAAGLFRVARVGFGVVGDRTHRAGPGGLAPVHVIGAARFGDLIETHGAQEVRRQAVEAVDAIRAVLAAPVARRRRAI